MTRKAIPLLILALSTLSVSCTRKNKTEHNETANTEKAHSAKAVVDAGCPHQKDGSCESADGPPPAKPGSTADGQLYGAPLGQSPEVALGQLLASPDEFHNKTVRVAGHVRRVCARKGCWMEVAGSDDPKAQGFRVTFKDYGFLVPVDSKGKSAKLEGLVQITQVKKAAVDHYESEGANFPRKEPDGTAREIRLVATGVELSQS